MADKFDLERFVAAQASVIDQVRRELTAGRKRTHWMWFVFPQIVGPGHSPMAQRYAISSLAEAEAYLEHPVLGDRLVKFTRLVTGTTGRTAHDIFGSPDDVKLHSSLTLFSKVAEASPEFARGLDRFFAGKPDQATLDRLRATD
jgi:uncharacterized protein (DUF1810 family)